MKLVDDKIIAHAKRREEDQQGVLIAHRAVPFEKPLGHEQCDTAGDEADDFGKVSDSWWFPPIRQKRGPPPSNSPQGAAAAKSTSAPSLNDNGIEPIAKDRSNGHAEKPRASEQELWRDRCQNRFKIKHALYPPAILCQGMKR
jgi:hypothetical protein